MNKDLVQLPNPRTKRWVVINPVAGGIIKHKRTLGAYKNIRIADDVKCDCTHKKKDHYLGEGQCNKCGCTWFHPEYQYCKPLRV